MNSARFNFEKFEIFMAMQENAEDAKSYIKANSAFYLREILSLEETEDLRKINRANIELRFCHYIDRKHLAATPWVAATFIKFVDEAVGAFIAYTFNPSRFNSEFTCDNATPLCAAAS